jgi:hypothetical protein
MLRSVLNGESMHCPAAQLLLGGFFLLSVLFVHFVRNFASGLLVCQTAQCLSLSSAGGQNASTSSSHC